MPIQINSDAITWTEGSTVTGVISPEVINSLTAGTFSGVVNTGNIQDGAVTNLKIAGPVDGSKITPNFESQNILTTGNAGIGTSTPEEALHISKGGNSSIRLGSVGGNFAYRLRANVSTSVNGGFIIEDAVNGNDLYEVRSGSSGFHAFSIDDTERMRINSSGKLLSPDGGAAFYGTVSNSGNGAIMETSSNSNGTYIRFANGIQMCWDLRGPGGDNPFVWTFPISFLAGSSVQLFLTMNTTGFARFATATGTQTTANIYRWTETGTNSFVSVHCLAMGIWK